MVSKSILNPLKGHSLCYARTKVRDVLGKTQVPHQLDNAKIHIQVRQSTLYKLVL